MSQFAAIAWIFLAIEFECKSKRRKVQNEDLSACIPEDLNVDNGTESKSNETKTQKQGVVIETCHDIRTDVNGHNSCYNFKSNETIYAHTGEKWK